MKSHDILLIEDDPHDAELVRRALRDRYPSAVLHVAKDHTAALELLYSPESSFLQQGLKCILLDLALPRVSGLEILRRLRQDSRTRHLPIVILSSSAEGSDIRAAYEGGANSYLVKATSYPEFAEEIGRLGHYWLDLNQAPRGETPGQAGP